MKPVKDELLAELKQTVKEVTGEDTDIKIEHSSNASHGDYSSNIALVLAKKLHKNPIELAEEIANKFKVSHVIDIEKVEAVKPGFINFFLSQKYLSKLTMEVLDDSNKVGKSAQIDGKKIMLEFTDPNPFKEFHIGHLRNLILGESYARLLENQGAMVWRVNYQGDVGLHVAKALYGIKKHEAKVKDLESGSISEKTKFLGEAYTFGAQAYESDEEAKKEIIQLNKQVYKQDSEIAEIWKKGREWSLNGFEEIYKRMGTSFKRYYFESETAQAGLKLVKEHIQDGVFEESQGAIVYAGEKDGLHTRVFVTKEGYPTYEGKDVALPSLKYKDFPYDESVILTAHEQASYFKVVLAAISKIFPDLGKKTRHHSFGFVSLKDGKMSSRTGNVITGQWLVDEAKRQIREQFTEMDEKTTEIVAIGAIKYSMLKFAPVSDIAFSFKDSISLEGDSGPYLQYTYVRTQSVLAKSQISNPKSQIDVNYNEEELSIMRWISRFNDITREAAQFAPNTVANYLFELAQRFNTFYQKHKIVGSPEEEQRLAVTAAVGIVIKNGLDFLGIQVPNKM